MKDQSDKSRVEKELFQSSLKVMKVFDFIQANSDLFSQRGANLLLKDTYSQSDSAIDSDFSMTALINQIQ